VKNGKTSVDLNDEIKTGIDVVRVMDEDKKPKWIEKMIDSGNNKGKKRLPIAKRLELINKMIKSGKAGHAGYHNPDKLKPEIEEFIDLVVSQFGLYQEQISYTLNQGITKYPFIQKNESKPEKDELDKLMEVEELKTIIESPYFDSGYRELWKLMDELKELSANPNKDLKYIESEGTDEDYYERFDFNINASIKVKSKSYLAEWIKQIVAEMRRDFPSLVHNINYEDLVLGVILYVIDQDRIRREIPYLAEYVEKLWGKDRFQDHLRHIYMVHNRVTDIYSESF
jgi:hypothetical protein